MRTVSFFSGTAAVFGVEPDGGVGGVFSGSLMDQGRKKGEIRRIPSYLANFAPLRQSLSPDALQLSGHCSLVAHLVVGNHDNQAFS